MQKLPCERLKVDLAQLCEAHGRTVLDGQMSAVWRDGLLCLAVAFPDGMTWEVPFDPGAQNIIQSANATKH